MFRAIVGTVAIVAGFAVLEKSVDTGEGGTGACKAAQAYALLRPGEQLAVRALPAPEGKVVATLAAREMTGRRSAPTVTIVASQSGWARIALADGEYTATDDAPRQFGWIPADQLSVDTRIDGAVTTFSRPGALGVARGSIEGRDEQFRVLGCRGSWLQVINAQRGNVWIDRWCGRAGGCRDG